MSLIQKMRDKWKRKRVMKTVGLSHADGYNPPVIDTAWGPVSEGARQRAALNMREDPALRLSIEKVLAQQLFQGDLVRGAEECKRRYREAYSELDGTY